MTSLAGILLPLLGILSSLIPANVTTNPTIGTDIPANGKNIPTIVTTNPAIGTNIPAHGIMTPDNGTTVRIHHTNTTTNDLITATANWHCNRCQNLTWALASWCSPHYSRISPP